MKKCATLICAGLIAVTGHAAHALGHYVATTSAGELVSGGTTAYYADPSSTTYPDKYSSGGQGQEVTGPPSLYMASANAMVDVMPYVESREGTASVEISRNFLWVESYPGEIPPTTVYVTRLASYSGTIHAQADVNSTHWTCEAEAHGNFTGDTLTPASEDIYASPTSTNNTDSISATTMTGATETYVDPNNAAIYNHPVTFQVTADTVVGAAAGGTNRAEADGDNSIAISSIVVSP